jgi:general secretion pathway protein F
MPTYEYRALSAAGSEDKGKLEADTPRAARQALRQLGLNPLELRESEGGITGNAFRSSRWPRAQRVLFTRQLATLLAAGMPLEAALAVLVEQSDEAATRQLIRLLRTDVAAGKPLSAALAEHPQTFDAMYCALVRVAEKTGRLDQVLADLAQHLEAGDAFRQRITVALVYPLAILVIALLVVGALLIHVVPQIVEVFVRQQQALPLLTRLLIALSNGLQVAWLPGSVAVVLGIWPLRRWLHKPRSRARVAALFGRLPLFGRLARIAGTQRFAATLAMALKGGVPLVPALALAAEVLPLPAQRAAVNSLSEAVSRGASLGAALPSGPRAVFEPALRHFVLLGERNGQLADMLKEVAKQERAALEYRLGWLAGLLEPALVVLMGGIVLVIVLAILLPIIEINQFLH